MINMDIDSIAQTLHVTTWDWVAVCIALSSFIVAIMSIIIAIKTLHSQRQTEKNTMPIMNNNIQEMLLKEMIRDVFDGYLRMTAINLSLGEMNYNSYPTEEKILELKIPTNMLHIDLYYNEIDKYHCLKGLANMIQQYNLRIDLLYEKLKSVNIPSDFVKETMDNLLYRNAQIANTWWYVMTLMFRYSDKMKSLVFEDILQYWEECPNDDIEYKYFNKNNVYLKFIKNSDIRNRFLAFMIYRTDSFKEEVKKRMIPKHI